MISPDSVVVRTGDLVTAPMGGELALMDMTTGTYFVLDEVAAAIWERLETPTTVRAICDQLRDRYDVPEERCEGDVMPFLQKLQMKNLLRLVDEP
ncbi:MAG TPA: PqqD family protein [Thermoanaerobaculia bacterium]